MYKIGENEMIKCPYNRYHVVSKLRIQKHIVKCKKNHPDVKLATCFYNYSHRLKPEEILEHYEVCSHKNRLEGARYDFACSTSTNSSVKLDSQPNSFPDINAKPKFFYTSGIDSSDSDFEEFQSSKIEKSPFKTHLSDDCNNNDDDDDDDYDNDDDDDNNDDDDDDNDDDNLEPLPLPKTVSKAFIYVKQNPKPLTNGSPGTSQSKAFGRGKNFFTLLSEKSRTTDHLLPNLSNVQISSPKVEEKCRFFLKSLPSSCNESVVSSMFDDTSTFKSEEILDKDICDEADDNVLFKNLDKYTKI